MSRSSVDLPQPDGPMSETNSPARTDRSTPSRAVTVPGPLPKILVTFETSTAARSSGGRAATFIPARIDP